MVNTSKLKQMIKEKGYTYTEVGKMIGITYCNMNNKLNNVTSFKGNEIYIICNLLDIGTWEIIKDVFFCNMENEAKKVS